MPTRFLNDCRRTAARNLIRASVPERVAMLLTSHKTRAIFDRYNIINEQELLEASAPRPRAPDRRRCHAHRAAPRRCCTNRDWPARCPPTAFSPADAIRHWSAEGGHPIEDLTAENGLTPLPSWTPGAKAIADDGLVAEERILHPALTMVP